MTEISRRRVLALAGGAAAAGAATGVGAAQLLGEKDPQGPIPLARTYAFRGPHQAGIATPAQDRLHFAAFDVTTTKRDQLIALLKTWTTAAEKLVAGVPLGTNDPYDAPPTDTGEALELPPSGLTITFGVGASLFKSADGTDRFGLASKLPAALAPLPHFPGDNLDLDQSDGDICIQACADDPQVAVHAIRNLARLGFGTVAVRWSQLGFGRTSSTSTSQATPRNLFGFKDGTANLKVEDPNLLDEHVWVKPGDDAAADWLAGGSYLVTRKIAMNIENWDRTSLREQEALVGRDRRDGAPLSGGDEFTPVNFSITGRGGKPLVPDNSHVALAHPERNNGIRMLRRGYNYTDGSSALGRLEAGLFFMCFVRDPRTHYVPMQTAMAKRDAMAEYLQHQSSGLFAILPGAEKDVWLGQSLFS
ncbi:MAG: iron uptake transporter deferrochelatase/peroxidase subunit [Propionibacteriaceae bacterium]